MSQSKKQKIVHLKVIFGNREGMWVQLISFDKDTATFIGILKNEPVDTPGLHWNDIVKFKDTQIREIRSFDDD